MHNSWTGFHYDGRTAHRAAVTIAVTGSGLHVVRDDGRSFLWPFAELRKVEALGQEAVRIERQAEPVETLTVTEAGLPEALRAVAPEAAQKLGRWSVMFDAGAQRTLGRIVIGSGLVAFTYFFGLPALAGIVAPKIPVAWEEELGHGLVNRMAPEARQCKDSVGKAAVEAIVSRLVSAAPPSPYKFRVALADDSIVNAFAAPGGYVVVNRGLMEATRTPEELAGVLAHELQHVLQRHSTRAMVREIPLQIAISAISGGADALSALASRAAGTLGVLRYRRGDELEADREGIRMLQAAQVDTKGMVDFFHTLSSRDSAGPGLHAVSYLSTHPQTADRIAKLEQLAAAASYRPVPLLPPDQSWDIVKAACERMPARY